MRSECCLAKASTSGVTVRVCRAVKRMRSLPWSDSTMVLPQVPSPTTAALIMLAPSAPVLVRPRQHGEDDAGQHPEHAIFDAADHPDPFSGHLVGRGCGHEQMAGGDGGDIRRVDVEHEPDGQE